MASRKIRTSDSHVIIAASDLASGATVYRDRLGGWSENAADAQVFEEHDLADATLHAVTDSSLEVVDAYLAASDGTGEPTHIRELIRRYGPTTGHAAGNGLATYEFVGVG